MRSFLFVTVDVFARHASGGANVIGLRIQMFRGKVMPSRPLSSAT